MVNNVAQLISRFSSTGAGFSGIKVHDLVSELHEKARG